MGRARAIMARIPDPHDFGSGLGNLDTVRTPQLLSDIIECNRTKPFFDLDQKFFNVMLSRIGLEVFLTNMTSNETFVLK